MESDRHGLFTVLFRNKSLRKWVTIPALIQLLVTIGFVLFFFYDGVETTTHNTTLVFIIFLLCSLLFAYRFAVRITKLVTHLEEEVILRTKELEERNKVLQQLSFSDSLTGIANRRQFDNTVKSAWNMALRHNRPVIIFMLDIDYFKEYNDTYGHQAGDDCLKAIGGVLNCKVGRVLDLAARYGGEEFIILLQDTRVEKMRDFAEEIRKSVIDLDISHSTSPFKRVTVSIGGAYMVPTLENTPAALIELADRALYQAKEYGRNNVVLSEN